MTIGAHLALQELNASANVRCATFQDVPRMEELGRAFFAVSDMEALATFCPGSFAVSLHNMIHTPSAILLVAEVAGEIIGFAGAMVFPAYWNDQALIAQETFWWVQPDYRGKAGAVLLQGLESEARNQGARSFLMVSLDALRPDAVGKLYERRGYAPLEHSYWKAI
jgi:GNAT superfamily N-acetyltransferase